MTVVRVYLDIDGVLLHEQVSAWGANVHRTIRLPRGDIKVVYAQELLDELRVLSTVAEIVWLTTWLEDDAIDILDHEIGLPPGARLPVPQRAGTDRSPTGWKPDALLVDQAMRPGPFVWVDDQDAVEITTDEPHLIITPRSRLGITPSEMHTIYQFAEARRTNDSRRPSARLLKHESEVIAIAREYKAVNVRVFGSIARGEDRPDSDVDLLVTWEDGASLYGMVDLIDRLQQLLGCQVDIVSDRELDNILGRNILRDAVALIDETPNDNTAPHRHRD